LVGSPLKFSETPVDYKLPPPRLGEHTTGILEALLGYPAERIQELFNDQVIS
jgi:crotonobetainyl-CoA:carnitine CoA-transferase CaiB-like acyl-CoA transferase